MDEGAQVLANKCMYKCVCVSWHLCLIMYICAHWCVQAHLCLCECLGSFSETVLDWQMLPTYPHPAVGWGGGL